MSVAARRALLARVARDATLGQIRYVEPVPPAAAVGLVAQVYQQVERDFGLLAPPISLHSPAPDPLAACWLMLRETLVATGLASRHTKEAVATAVSLANMCPYCVEVHAAALSGLSSRSAGADASAVAADRVAAVTDPALRAVAAWARGSATRATARAATGDAAPFPPEHAPELIGVAMTFHYLNRMVNVFLPPSPVPVWTPAAARRSVAWVAARLMGSLARPERRPGDSLDLLPAAPLPPDMGWSAARAEIATAVSRAAAAIDAAGSRSVPPRVRQLVGDRLAAWDGEPIGIGERAWLDLAATGVPDGERPAARLALLVAFASYWVTDAVIGDVRAQGYDDRRLVELASWASLAAARQVGARSHREP